MPVLTRIIVALLVVVFGVWLWHHFSRAPQHVVWDKTLTGIGSFSSPRAEDMNGDGVLDIIIGAGKAEFEHSDSAMVALDGKSGELIWKTGANDQIFGSAGLYDINLDGVKDVFFTGRSSEFQALDGRSGKLIWKFDSTVFNPQKERWFNFYNPQFIQDVDADGLADILVSNGGDIKVPPFNPNRAAGRLAILSSATGSILAEAAMPDGKEIYMSVAVNFDSINPTSSKIIFGTGGETVPGNLFVGTIDMVLKGDLSGSRQLATGPKKGFIAPPAWVDLNGDGALDIIANSVDGRVLSFDGKTLQSLWQVGFARTEAYTSMAIGQFTNDQIPDFFVSFAKGRWPYLSATKQAMINGANGHVEFLDSLGYYQTSSPVVADLNEDGFDDVLLSVDNEIIEGQEKVFYTSIYAIDFAGSKVQRLTEPTTGHNLSSTPWVGDLDHDGYLDVVFCNSTDKHNKLSQSFDGMQVHCISTSSLAKGKPKWGAYMGSNYDGVYQ
jgi:outer membrane protein assembly factor BamB